MGMRSDIRNFLETKDRELGNLQDKITQICTGLVAEGGTLLTVTEGVSTSMTPNKRSLVNERSEPQIVKKVKQDVVGIERSEPQIVKKVKQDVIGGSSFALSDGFTQVYTDGACSNNGQFGARAGVGVWWGEGHPLNIAQPVSGDKHTNNTAEIQAACLSISQAMGAGIRKLEVNTDSQFLINCVTNWMAKWKKNGWKTGSGQEVKNKEDLLEIDKLLQGGRVEVKWNHVKGHSNVRGNNEADRLAVKGASM